MKRVQRSSTLGQGFGNMSLNATTLVLNLAITVLLSRRLGTAGFGEYSFAIAASTLLAVPAVLGLTPLLVREIAGYRAQSRWPELRGLLRRANEAVLLVSVTLVVGGAAVAWLVSWPNGHLFRPTLLALLLVPLIAITSVRQGAMQGFGRVVVGRLPESGISPALLLAFAGALAFALGSRFSATWAVGANLAGAVIAATLGLALLRRTLPGSVRDASASFETRRWARAAIPFVVFSIVSAVSGQIPTVLLGALDGPHAAGIYAVAFRVANLLPFLLVAMMPALMPAIADLHVRGEHEEVERLTGRAARVVFLGSLPLGLAALLLARPLLSIFGGGFAAGETTLRILAVGQLVNVATGFAGTVLLMVGEAVWVTIGGVAGALTTLVLGAVLIPTYSTTGAAVAVAASTAVTNVFLATILWRRRAIYSPAIRFPGRVRSRR